MGAAMLLEKASEVEADKQWAEDTFSSLHTVAKIETLTSQGINVIAPEKWNAFCRLYVNKTVRNGAEHHRQEIEDALAELEVSTIGMHKSWDISLDFTSGGAQYLSC